MSRLGAVFCGILLVASIAAAAEPEIDPALRTMLRDLAAKSAPVKTIRAHFEQRKRLAIVTDELRSSGTLLLDKQGAIVWDVREPEAARIVLSKAGIYANGKSVVGGDGAPAGFSPLPMLESMNDVFAGVSENTTRSFEITRLAADRLRLVPRSAAVKAWLEAMEIEVDPKRGTPTRVRLLEPGGDTTEVTLSAVELNPTLPQGAFAP